MDGRSDAETGSAVRGQFVAIFGLGLVVRLLLWHQARSIPWLAEPVLDGQAYLAWARSIAAGDWLGSGLGVFYQAPLYPYFLSSILGLGGGIVAIRTVQILCGALAAGLVAKATARLFGPRAGWFGGVAFALFPPILVADLQIDKTSLSVTLASALLAAVVAARGARQPELRWLTVGALTGALALVRENALVLSPLLAFVAFRDRPAATDARRWQLPVALLLGLGLALAPSLLRNRWVGGEWFFTTAQSGPNFYIGNRSGASGSYESLIPGRSDAPLERQDAESLAESETGHPMSAREVSSWYWQRSFREIAASPAAAAAGFLRKLRWTLHRFEIPDSESLLVYYREIPLLGALATVWNFGTLVLLAALGLVSVEASSRRTALVLGCAVVSTAAAIALFFVLGRYRAPLAVALIPLAASFIAGWPANLRSHGSRAAASLVAASMAWLVLPRLGIESTAPPAMVENNLGVAWARAGHLDLALDAYRRALAQDAGLREANLNLGNLLFVQGERRESMERLERAAADAPSDQQIQELVARARAIVRQERTQTPGAGFGTAPRPNP